MKIAFSLLHYNNIGVTNEAVAHLLSLHDIEDCEIIIVDNSSPNGTGTELKKQYNGIPNIHVLILEKNGGFAYGNNAGFQHAKSLGSNLVVVMNNDVFIQDADFIHKLLQAVSKTDAEIIAPHIIGRKGPQNPFRTERLSDEKIKKLLRYNTFINVLYHIPIVRIVLAYMLDKKNRRKKSMTPIVPDDTACIPHGSCVIFLPRWTEKEEFAFVPKTFMYGEEDILGEYLWEKGYHAVYKSGLVVHHAEDASVEYDNKSSVKRRLFISDCMIDSFTVLKKMREQGREK